MNAKKIFFYVQHLWGVGHVYRATRVASALSRHGFQVHLIWGGTEIPGFDFTGISVHRLTPVRSRSAEFSELVHADGHPFGKEDEEARCAQLLELFDRISPDILITEAFPFGRRQMRFELLPLLEHAAQRNPRPMTVASIRDIMQEGRREKRVNESVRWVQQWFDVILVHGDPAFIEIGETLQGTEHFAEKIRYSGIVSPEDRRDAENNHGTCDVLVSVGGGAFGKALLSAALKAHPLCNDAAKNWLVAAGTELADRAFSDLQNQVPQGVRLVRHIPNLVSAMRQSRVSVSHCGYNTVADLLVAGTKAVLYPYTGGRETEQLRRAQRLQERGIAIMLEPGKLEPPNLVTAIEQALHMPSIAPNIDINGAEQSAKILAAEFDRIYR